MTLRAAIAAFLALGLAAEPGAAQTLTLAVGAPITAMDPHYHNYTPNFAIARHVFDSLFALDPAARVQPLLAQEYRPIDNGWEITLRDGVAFHDGAPLTAEDVAFTIARVPAVPNSPSSPALYTRAIKAVEVTGPRTLRLRTDGLYPLLPNDLCQVLIVSRVAAGAGALPLGATTEDFNAGRATIGTGAFRFVSYRAGDRVELERNEAFWGAKPAWQRVSYRMISNDTSRLAALLAGDVQFIDAVPTSDIARLAKDGRVRLSQAVSLRVIYLVPDLSRTGPTPFVVGANGESLERNPLRDQRVREALSVAINRGAIVERIMEGAAIPSGQFLPPGGFSAVPDLAPPVYDPARAKQLLAEAGFPNGLRVTLHGPNDRYLNDAKIIQSVGQMWSRIGVQTAVEAQPWTTFVGRASKQEFSLWLGGWASGTGEASSPLRSLVGTADPATGWGASNRGRYSNAAVDRLLAEALRTPDDAAREKLLQESTRVAIRDVGIIPLHNQKNTWAMAPGLVHVPRADEETRAEDIKPTP